jgi:elongation factor Ts
MTATITAADVKELRARTGAGMMECKKALVDANGDMEQAIELLRIKGAAKAATRGERVATQGTVQSYIHAGGTLGVLVEVNCETDFVARNEDFTGFARDIAMHIAAANPLYVTTEDVPEDAVEAEKRVFAEQASDKPENVREKIVEGKLRKWYEEVVLLEQPHVNTDKYEGRTIEQIRQEIAHKTGENVVIRHFARFQVGA